MKQTKLSQQVVALLAQADGLTIAGAGTTDIAGNVAANANFTLISTLLNIPGEVNSGATLTLTFVEVFAWIYIWLRHLPALHVYAPLIILGGGLVLMVERRILELRGSILYSTESFLGFALVLLGLLLMRHWPRRPHLHPAP